MNVALDDSPRRAAIVDDDRLVRQLVRATLEAKGYDVVEGDSGASGLRLAREPLDVLLLDLNMPDINGLAVCRALRGAPQTADVPVMFLTASHDERTVVSCLQAGANDYISKPFAEAILQARVDMVVKAHRAERGRRRALAELSNAYEALKESRADAVLNHRLTGLGVLASGLAHEMNSPLGALLSCLDYAVDDPPDPNEAKVALQEARQSAVKIAELVKRMKAIAGTGERSLAQIDLKAQCESISRVFIGQPVRITVKGDAVVVKGDESELHQAMMALVENAVQAAQTNPAARVDLVVGREGENGVVVVDDNGPGVDDADLPFIFDPFFTKKRLWTTPGLGLSIARAAAHRHGGDVRIEGRGPLGGARAVFSVPVQGNGNRTLEPAVR
jgi:C4-dicarboxylate-specific signal transduction histidine kinase